MAKFGCTTPFGFNLDFICTDKLKSIEAMNLYTTLNRKTHQIKECPYPCQFIKSMMLPYKMRNDIKSSQLNFGKYIKVTKAKYSYTELELLAEFGGYVGLFLGISVFHLSEVIDKIIEKILNN